MRFFGFLLFRSADFYKPLLIEYKLAIVKTVDPLKPRESTAKFSQERKPILCTVLTMITVNALIHASWKL